MKGIVIIVLLALFSANASGAEFFKFYYGEHEIIGVPSDLGAVKGMLDESRVPARVVADGVLTRLDGEFPIDTDMRRHEAIVDFVARHRAAFGLRDPREELGIQLEEASKVPFQTSKREDQAYLSVFVQYIPRESSRARLRVYTVSDMIVRVESTLVPTFDYEYTPAVSPYDALDKALFELGDEESYYKDDISITIERGERDGVFLSCYRIELLGKEHTIRVRVDADTGKVVEVDKNAKIRTEED